MEQTLHSWSKDKLRQKVANLKNMHRVSFYLVDFWTVLDLSLVFCTGLMITHSVNCFSSQFCFCIAIGSFAVYCIQILYSKCKPFESIDFVREEKKKCSQ